MQPIVKFGLTKSGMSSTLHKVARYGPRSLGGIGLFDPFVTQGAGQIAFLVEHYWKLTPSRPLLWANLSRIKIEAGRGGSILLKKLHQNSTVATYRVLYTQGMEIHVYIPNQHI